MMYFPYNPRENQKKIIDAVRKALSARAHLLLDSPTGSGKTVAVLAPCIDYALAHGKKILYLTKTNTQQEQVFKELRRIREGMEFTALGLQGRTNLCSLFRELEGAASEELAKLCRDRKKRTAKSLGISMENVFFVDEDSSKILDISEGCPFFANLISNSDLDFPFKGEVRSVDEVFEYAKRYGLCSYELIKANIKEADVVVAPYPYFFISHIQRALLNWWGTTLENLIVIADEAHNLIEYCREIESISLSKFTAHAALAEAEEMGGIELVNGMRATEFLAAVERMLEECAKEYAKEEEGFVPPDFINSWLLSNLKLASNQLRCGLLNLLQLGEVYSERKRMEGKLPRSYMRAVANFILAWFSIGFEEYTRLVKGGENPELIAYCLNPGLATLPFCSLHASIHMSGTLAPLAEYRDSMGLSKERCILLELPSPFPKENLLILYDKSVTTRYEEITAFPEILEIIKQKIVELCNSIQRNIIVFFPSFSLMEKFINSEIENRIERDVYVESREMSSLEISKLVEGFRDYGKAKVMFAVTGGRLSEGMDFPDKQLEVVVIVGIPYPKPSARQKALQIYYDMKFGKGWEYAVHAPTARKIRQAIGRLIRNERDRGVGVILDRRAVHFSDMLDGLRPSQNLAEEIRKFFGEA